MCDKDPELRVEKGSRRISRRGYAVHAETPDQWYSLKLLTANKKPTSTLDVLWQLTARSSASTCRVVFANH